jgi:hypothetical protein
MRVSRRPLLALFAAAAVLLVGCGSTGGDTAATTATPAPAIHAEIARSRLFELQRELKLVLRNDEDEPVAIDSIRLESPLFEPAPTKDRHSELQPGRAVSMPIPFGPSVCEATDDEPPTVVVSVAGEAHRLTIVPQPEDALTVLNGRECQIARIRAAADLGFGTDLTRSGDFAVSTTLDLDRRQDGHSIEVPVVRSSVVFALRADAGGQPSVQIGPADDHDSVGVTFTASRCDSHALTESKKTFIFVAFVSLDGAPAVRVELETDGELREVLEGFIEACH